MDIWKNTGHFYVRNIHSFSYSLKNHTLHTHILSFSAKITELTPYLVNKNLSRKKKQPEWYPIQPCMILEYKSVTNMYLQIRVHREN